MKNPWFAQIAFSIALLSGCHSTGTSDFMGFARGDAGITASVESSLQQNPELSGSPLVVTTEQGVVTLKGYVHKIRQADIAAELARNTPGVTRVENRIVVRP